MATVTKGRTFVSGETVTPTKLNELVDLATVTSIVDADISASAAIASSKLATTAQQSLVPAGAVMAFAMNAAPSGWLAADGSAVSRATYAALFAAISTTHGAGNGSTTFNLPDLRGYFVRGSGTNSDGTAAGTFGAKQADDNKAHTHTGITSTTGAHTHAWGTNNRQATAAGAGMPGFGNTADATGSAGNHSHTFTTDSSGTETRPRNIALLYCIKF